jgi:hypothetical protein
MTILFLCETALASPRLTAKHSLQLMNELTTYSSPFIPL